jgi:agmatine/peptidylarginine deiminase
LDVRREGISRQICRGYWQSQNGENISPEHVAEGFRPCIFYYAGNNKDQIRICDFRFTSYRNIPYEQTTVQTQLLDNANKKIAELLGVPLSDSKLVLEGGSFEVNGKGTIILVDSLLLKRKSEFKALSG